jgi:hypothetical protein
MVESQGKARFDVRMHNVWVHMYVCMYVHMYVRK